MKNEAVQLMSCRVTNLELRDTCCGYALRKTLQPICETISQKNKDQDKDYIELLVKEMFVFRTFNCSEKQN